MTKKKKYCSYKSLRQYFSPLYHAYPYLLYFSHEIRREGGWRITRGCSVLDLPCIMRGKSSVKSSGCLFNALRLPISNSRHPLCHTVKLIFSWLNNARDMRNKCKALGSQLCHPPPDFYTIKTPLLPLQHDFFFHHPKKFRTIGNFMILINHWTWLRKSVRSLELFDFKIFRCDRTETFAFRSKRMVRQNVAFRICSYAPRAYERFGPTDPCP